MGSAGRIRVAIVAALLLVGMVAGGTPVRAAGVVGGGFPESCTEEALAAALAGGGIVSFNCGSAPRTILLTSRKLVTGVVVVDGDGLITLSGGGTNGIFAVAPGATLELRQMTLTGGSDPQGNGGAIANAGTLRLDRTTIAGNMAYAGGGVANDGGVVEVAESTLTGNEAGIGGGGGIFNDAGTVTIERSTLAGNHSTFNGGGVFSRGGSLTIVNSTLSGNDAAVRGGGVYHAGSFSVSWTTFAGNRALFDAGGSIYSLGELTFGSVILAGGLPHNCAGLSSYNSLGHNLSSDGSCSAGGPGDQHNANPRLGLLQANGGPTLTHLLLGGSRALDQGGSDACPPTDQRGVARPVDGDGDGDAVCDAGSVEAPLNVGPGTPGAPALANDSASPNRGVFTLIWPPAADPEGDPLTYTLLHKEAGQAEYTQVASRIAANTWSFTEGTPEEPGVWTYVVRASDGGVSGPLSPVSQQVTVTLDPLGTTIGIPNRRPHPPDH